MIIAVTTAVAGTLRFFRSMQEQDALRTDHRSEKVVQLISELYWIELDYRIHLMNIRNNLIFNQ